MNLKRLVFSSTLLAGVVFGSVCNTNASPVTYTNYQLYAYCDNNYTNTHSKQTTTLLVCRRGQWNSSAHFIGA